MSILAEPTTYALSGAAGIGVGVFAVLAVVAITITVLRLPGRCVGPPAHQLRHRVRPVDLAKGLPHPGAPLQATASATPDQSQPANRSTPPAASSGQQG